MSKRKKNSFNSKRNIVIVLIATIVVLGAIILLFFNKDTAPGEHFSEKKYYKISYTGDMEGPGTSYMFFDTNGEFENFTTILASPSGDVGHYEIKDNKLYATNEYGYHTCGGEKGIVGYLSEREFTLKISGNTINYTDDSDHEFKEISSSEYKEARSKWGKSYSEAKRIYKTNPGSYPNICD